MIRPDDIALCHQYKPKASAQTKAEYATPYEHYRRPITRSTKAMFAIAAALVAGAFWMGVIA